MRRNCRWWVSGIIFPSTPSLKCKIVFPSADIRGFIIVLEAYNGSICHKIKIPHYLYFNSELMVLLVCPAWLLLLSITSTVRMSRCSFCLGANSFIRSSVAPPKRRIPVRRVFEFSSKARGRKERRRIGEN